MSIEGLPLFEQPRAAAAPAAAAQAAEPRVQSVSELTQEIRGALEPAFKQVWVRGEVSNYRPAASGHAYFSLKDSAASISAAAFGWGKRGAPGRFELRDGLEVVCQGRISVYPPRGSYQLVVDRIEPLGAGALQVAFEQLKEKLSREGLFEASRKRAVPGYPLRVAVVTSPSGAAVRDILTVMGRRAPHVRVTIVPAVVQGEGAAAQIIRGLEAANRHELGDVVILARGGGSIEDLWCFNDEKLARAIAASRLPVVSAVGHEIDFTISDFVADLRAPTPSAAAEIVTQGWVDAGRRLGEARERLRRSVVRDLEGRRQVLRHVAARLVDPRSKLREQAQRCDDLAQRLDLAIRNRLQRRRAVLDQSMAKLDALSPLRVLDRGYSIVLSDGVNANDTGSNTDQVVKSAKQVAPGQGLRIRFRDGEVRVRARDSLPG